MKDMHSVSYMDKTVFTVLVFESNCSQEQEHVSFPSRVNEPTCQDSTHDARDALDLSQVVVDEVLVAGGVEERWIAEHAPQLGGDCPIGCLNGLGTHVEGLPHQSAVPQDAHTGEQKGTTCLKGELL